MKKKGALDEIIKMILWVILFLILSIGIYYLTKRLTT